jgi:hypothetical protein
VQDGNSAVGIYDGNVGGWFWAHGGHFIRLQQFIVKSQQGFQFGLHAVKTRAYVFSVSSSG